MVYILHGKVTAFAVDVQEPIAGSRIQHGFPHSGVMRVGDVNHGELDRGCCVCHLGLEVKIVKNAQMGKLLGQVAGHIATSGPIAYLEYRSDNQSSQSSLFMA